MKPTIKSMRALLHSEKFKSIPFNGDAAWFGPPKHTAMSFDHAYRIARRRKSERERRALKAAGYYCFYSHFAKDFWWRKKGTGNPVLTRSEALQTLHQKKGKTR